MLIIPAIDLMDGKVVRLKKGDFKEKKVYFDDAVRVARRWKDEGARRLHIVDLDGAMKGLPQNIEVISKIAKEVKIPIEVGGGIRDFDTVKKFFDWGVSYVIVGTKGLEEEFLNTLLLRFPYRIILSLDARDGILFSKGWQESIKIGIFEYLPKLKGLELESIIVTDILRDGTLKGVNVEFAREVSQKSPLQIIISGGISSLRDILLLSEIEDLKGVIVGRALYENRIDLQEAIKSLER